MKIQMGVALLCLVLTYPLWLLTPFEFLFAIKNHSAILQELAYRGASSSYYIDRRASLHDNDLEGLLSAGSISSVCGLVGAAMRWISHPLRHLAWLIWILTVVGAMVFAHHPTDHGGRLLPPAWTQWDGRFLVAALLGLVGLLSSISAHVFHRASLLEEFGD